MERKWSINIERDGNKITISCATDLGTITDTILSEKPTLEIHKFIKNKLYDAYAFAAVNETLGDESDNNILVVTAQDMKTNELVLMEVDGLYEPGDIVRYWNDSNASLEDLTCVSYTAQISESVFNYLIEENK